jgi:hypothetical protein
VTGPYRDELQELDHLEPPMGPPTGGSASGLWTGPAHAWAPTPLVAEVELCDRCGLSRFQGRTRHRGPPEWVYQLRNGQYRAGGEPCCARGNGRRARR